MNTQALWISLQQAKGIGCVGLCEIHSTLTALNLSIEDLFDLNEQEIRNEFSFKENIVKAIVQAKISAEEIEDTIEDMSTAGINPIFIFDSAYPSILKDRLKSESPSILYCLGETKLLQNNACAILGSSEISNKGESITYKTVNNLVNHNITIISGMNKGVGTLTHKSAIESKGTTIGVLPCGFFTFNMSDKLKQIYNPDNFLIISPYFLKEEFSLFKAMERNKIICAMSKAVMITEAPERSESGIFEAGKSTQKLQIPLFTAEYAEYPESAKGNIELLKNFGAIPIRGKRSESGEIIPNTDTLIAKLKF